MTDWRNWTDCPYCKKGHLQYNGHAAGTEILTVFFKCSRCRKETQFTDAWDKISKILLEKSAREVVL